MYTTLILILVITLAHSLPQKFRKSAKPDLSSSTDFTIPKKSLTGTNSVVHNTHSPPSLDLKPGKQEHPTDFNPSRQILHHIVPRDVPTSSYSLSVLGNDTPSVRTISVPASRPRPSVKLQPSPDRYQQGTPPIAIVRQSQSSGEDGSFSYSFETANGISVQARGFLKNPGTGGEAQVIEGQYSYMSPDGTPVFTRFLADENGFHPEGVHIPALPATATG